MTKTLFIEVRDERGVTEVWEPSDEEMAELGWIRSEAASEIAAAVAQDGQRQVVAMAQGMAAALGMPPSVRLDSDADSSPTRHDVPDLEVGKVKTLMPSPSPKTLEGLHRVLTWLVAEGYEPARETDPVATLCIAGKSWAVGKAWFIDTTAPGLGGDVAIDCRAVRAELEKQAKHVVDAKPLVNGHGVAEAEIVAGLVTVGDEKPLAENFRAAGALPLTLPEGSQARIWSERANDYILIDASGWRRLRDAGDNMWLYEAGASAPKLYCDEESVLWPWEKKDEKWPPKKLLSERVAELLRERKCFTFEDGHHPVTQAVLDVLDAKFGRTF